MNSFDLFDTLITRLTSKPEDVFQILEEQLRIPGFALNRMRAERDARKHSGTREITLDEIYQRMGDLGRPHHEVKAREIALETQLCTGIKQNIQKLSDGPSLVVSDMYLPKAALENILSGLLPNPCSLDFIVSCEEGERKSTGLLWDIIKKRLPELKCHTGDNYRSDVEEPAQRGIKSVHFRSNLLNRYEQALSAASFEGSVLAGVSRATRLGVVGSEHDRRQVALTNTFSSVFAPLFVMFVDWVLEQASARGITALLFLARDGQLLHLIATELIKRRGLGMTASYVFGSRQALNIPGFDNIEDALPWILEDTNSLTLRDLALRTELDVELVRTIGADYGFVSLDAEIPRSKRELLKVVVRDPRFVSALTAVSAAYWSAAFDYYSSVGVERESKVAFVDVGWTGKMLKSLRQMLDKAQSKTADMTGLLMGSSRRSAQMPPGLEVKGFLFDQAAGEGSSALDYYKAIVEVALAATHGTTLRFGRDDAGQAIPILKAGPGSEELEGIRQQHQIVMHYVDLYLRAEQVIGRKISVPGDLLLRNLLRFLQEPCEEDVLAFSRHSHFDGQGDTQKQTLVRKLPWHVLFTNPRNLGLWPEGVICASGLGPLNAVLQRARTIKNFAGSRLVSNA